MRLLRLTDAVYETGYEEYVEVDEIARVETRMIYAYKEVEVEKAIKSGLFSRTKNVKVKETVRSIVSDGSTIFLKREGKTYVKESPAQIAEMIKNKQFVEA